MGYRRAAWHSGLTYVQTCPTCKAVLPHSEEYAIDKPEQTVTVDMSARAAFCTSCGKPFKEDANFCTGCGKKR